MSYFCFIFFQIRLSGCDFSIFLSQLGKRCQIAARRSGWGEHSSAQIQPKPIATRVSTFFYSAVLSLTLLVSCPYSALPNDSDSLFFNEPTMDNNTFALMRHHKIRRLTVSINADEHVFDDSTLLPGLVEVTLRGSEARNNQLLHHLSENFPNLNRLTIVQIMGRDAITANSLRLIGQFKNLQSLDLECLLAPDESNFAKYVPPNLRRLRIDASAIRNSHSLELPALQELDLRGSVDSKLLNSLQLPMLKTLTIDRGRVERDTFENVGRFKHLDQVNVGWQQLAPEESKMLRRHHIRVHMGAKPSL